MSAPRPPSRRRLRAYAFDPSFAVRLRTAMFNEVVLDVRWEDGLAPGPIGEYLEVVDVDPASDRAYPPVDLDHPYVLACDGLAPTEDDPCFHQQMAYSVAMRTVEHFEDALGRVALWATRMVVEDGELRSEFVRRLRVYPHALREANAYYSPEKIALLFGYFPAPEGVGLVPGNMIFTCLSHDVVAHETSHALLDGIHPRFAEDSNPDVLALHEAFADLVAILQHFSHRDVLRHELARSGGDLSGETSLAQLAQEFGRGIGRSGALRDALGGVDPETGRWERGEPSPGDLERSVGPHARGSVLVAAVFDAFTAVYERSVAGLLALARDPRHPELIDRLADEAARTARHVLRICIRALDYCPPVDVSFGDYLRALITADSDVYASDARGYRVALVEAFRRRGIYPRGVRSLSQQSLRWRTTAPGGPAELDAIEQGLGELLGRSEGKGAPEGLSLEWGLESDREDVWRAMQRNGARLHAHLAEHGRAWGPALGLVLDGAVPPSVYVDDEGRPRFEVHSVRTARRHAGRGNEVVELVVEITQRRRGWLDPRKQRAIDAGEEELDPDDHGDFTFRAGCTVLVDPRRGRLRYAITTHGDVCDADRLERHRAHLAREDGSLRALYGASRGDDEAFAALHRAPATGGGPR